MGIYDRLQRARADVTFQAVDPLDPRFYESFLSFASNHAGFPISAETAKRVSTVFACNSLIAETIASLPCVIYRRMKDGSKERARDHRLYRVLRHQPNAWQAPLNFFGDGQMCVGMKGNSFAEIVDDGLSVELHPLTAETVTVEQLPSKRLRYIVREQGKPPRTLLQEQMLHVRDLSVDAFTGQARASLAREAIAVAAAAEAAVGGFFKNDMTGRVVIKHNTTPNEEQRKQYREEFQRNYAGWANRSKALWAWGGLDVSELGKHDDAGFLVDPRRFQVADVARFWRVPLFMIGLEEKSTTWGTGIEQQMQGFVNFTIKPWLDRWAQALQLALLDEAEREEFFIEFLLADLVRGDLKTRMESYQIGRAIGVWSANEIRLKENEPKRPGGDAYQDNTPGAAPNAGQPERPKVDPDEDEEEPEERVIPAPLLADAAARISSEECREVERRAAREDLDHGKFLAWVRKFAAEHRQATTRIVAPLAEAYGFESWVVELVAARVERTMVQAFESAVPEGWPMRRREEVAALITETFRAGRAVRRAA